MFMRTKVALGALVALALFTTSTYADHWDRPSCYIDVHDGCFNTGGTPCSQEEYEEFLDMCDVAYPKAVIYIPPSLTAGEQSPGIYKRR